MSKFDKMTDDEIREAYAKMQVDNEIRHMRKALIKNDMRNKA